jgi:hypothetical protein
MNQLESDLIQKNIDLLITYAVNELEGQIVRLKQQCEENADTNISRVIFKFLDWRINNQQLLWEFTREFNGFKMSHVGFIGWLTFFVSNYLLDDSGFKIEWKKRSYIEFKNEVDFEKYVACTKDDKDAEPFLQISYDDDNWHQNPDLILEAMDIMEKNELRRQKEREEFDLFIKSYRR